MSTLWKVTCMENKYPGMWQRWYKNQCIATGWAATWGYKLHGPTKGGRGWSAARKSLIAMEVGDFVVVALRGHRVGRVGEITGKLIEDDKWNPLVPVGTGLTDGEMGRRVEVRWDLTVGPGDPDLVVKLPPHSFFKSGELRPAVSRIRSMTVDELRKTMNEPSNWVSLFGIFRYEKAISDYLATYPHHLEDGLLAHPNSKIREKVFRDKSRLDVLLMDKSNKAVIVECKQNAPSDHDIGQLRNYMHLLRDETGEMPRGILVHGGAPKLSQNVISAAAKEPAVEVVSYALDVNFRQSLVHG